jgi:hypothetical protein
MLRSGSTRNHTPVNSTTDTEADPSHGYSDKCCNAKQALPFPLLDALVNARFFNSHGVDGAVRGLLQSLREERHGESLRCLSSAGKQQSRAACSTTHSCVFVLHIYVFKYHLVSLNWPCNKSSLLKHDSSTCSEAMLQK